MYFLPKFKRGVFNRYRKGMPWPEMLIKDASAAGGILLQFVLGRSKRVLLVYPHFPSRGSTIFRIAHNLGYNVTNNISRAKRLAIYWEYNTVRNEFQALSALKSIKVINLYNRDISKDKVDDAMHQAFGYSTKIDPRTHEGIAVKKSLKNAVHDGRKIECPTIPEPGFIYQKFIDSTVNTTEVMDIRVPLFRGAIPHVYLNYRSNQERFKNVPDRAELAVNVDAWLSETEVSQLAQFCEIFNLEFGELDVLRDKDDGKIYIVDANNTPQGPPKNLPKPDKKIAVGLLSKMFEKTFMND